MRIGLDTNVLISGIFWSGTPSKILEGGYPFRWPKSNSFLSISSDLLDCHSRAGGNPHFYREILEWTPAYAGVTSHFQLIRNGTKSTFKTAVLLFPCCKASEQDSPLLEYWINDKYQVLTTQPILEEYSNTLNRVSKGKKDSLVYAWMLFIVENGIVVNIRKKFKLSADPDDDKFIEKY